MNDEIVVGSSGAEWAKARYCSCKSCRVLIQWCSMRVRARGRDFLNITQGMGGFTVVAVAIVAILIGIVGWVFSPKGPQQT